MHRIAVVSHKGGTGKTLTAVNLAAALAATGRRILLVDCDPQSAVAASLAFDVTKPALYEVLVGQVSAKDAVYRTTVDGVDLLPSDLDLSGAEIELPASGNDWRMVLRTALHSLARKYDVALIDTAPGLGVLPYLGLLASTSVLVVCPPDFLGYAALKDVLTTVKRAEAVIRGLRLLGIVPTMTMGRTRHEREVLEALRADHAGLVLPEIPRRVAFQDAALAGQPVIIYAPGSNATAAVGELAMEVLNRAEAKDAAK